MTLASRREAQKLSCMRFLITCGSTQISVITLSSLSSAAVSSCSSSDEEFDEHDVSNGEVVAVYGGNTTYYKINTFLFKSINKHRLDESIYFRVWDLNTFWATCVTRRKAMKVCNKDKFENFTWTMQCCKVLWSEIPPVPVCNLSSRAILWIPWLEWAKWNPWKNKRYFYKLFMTSTWIRKIIPNLKKSLTSYSI